jgi:ssDNA-binding Zn-finger/Zn-ribbon topoisomerase 1
MDKLERRNSALEENTAQDEFVSLISNLRKAKKDISITVPLHGKLDLSVISNMGFKLLSISFSPGDITELRNIPDSIKSIECPDNLLTDLEDLPDSLEKLEVPNNMIQELNMSRIKRLTHLNISFNRLKELGGFPENLKELVCSHNEIKTLDFEHTPALAKLHCDYNPRLVLYNLPDTLTDTEFPSTMVYQKTSNMVYQDSLREYFQIKQDYENKIQEKRREKKKIRVPCVGCGRTGGMIFSSKNEKYIAICGNRPACDWKIELYRGFYSEHEELLYVFMEDVEEYKEDIIRQKMNTLFGYTSENRSSKLFEMQLLTYNKASAQIKELLAKHEELYNNPLKKELIKMKQTEIQSWIQEVKYALIDNDVQRATEIQAREILPRAEFVRRQMYEEMNVVLKKDTYTLVQEPVQSYKTEELLSEAPAVIHFGKS